MRILINCIVIILAATSVLAQWQYGGIEIGYGRPKVEPRLASDGSGGVFIVWEGYFEDVDSSHVVVNHFDSSGTALFGERGIWLSNGSRDARNKPVIASDGLGGCIVVWKDTVQESGEINSFYAQRISHTGNLLWGSGRRLFYGSNFPNHEPSILADTSFGLLVVCTYDTGAGKYGILGQRLDYQGNFLWDSSGVMLHWPPGMVHYANVELTKICSSLSMFYCAWVDCRNYDQNDDDIYLQKFDAFGNINFGLGGLAISTSRDSDGDVFERQSLQVISDGIGGVVVGWLCDVVQLPRTLKAQRVDSLGQSFGDQTG